MVDISVILPTFNEKENITSLTSAIARVLEKTKRSFEILVVDDHSPDGTAALVRGHAQQFPKDHVRVIERMHDHGLGNSIGEGVEAARGNIIVGMDADFNHDPKYIPALLEKLRSTQLVVGSRFKKGGGMHESWRMIPTFLFNASFKLLGFPIMDNTSGFYSIRKSDLKQLHPKEIYYGYGDYHLRLVYFAKMHHYTIAEIPVYYGARLGGQSKSRFLEMIISYMKEAVRLAFTS